MQNNINDIIDNLIKIIERELEPYNNQLKCFTLSALLINFSLIDYEKEEFLRNMETVWDSLKEELEDEGN